MLDIPSLCEESDNADTHHCTTDSEFSNHACCGRYLRQHDTNLTEVLGKLLLAALLLQRGRGVVQRHHQHLHRRQRRERRVPVRKLQAGDAKRPARSIEKSSSQVYKIFTIEELARGTLLKTTNLCEQKRCLSNDVNAWKLAVEIVSNERDQHNLEICLTLSLFRNIHPSHSNK